MSISKLSSDEFQDVTARWWQWAHSIPKEDSPIADSTGEKSHQRQYGSVWFLSGTNNNLKTVRQCKVPEGKAILLPIINFDCTYAEFPHLKTEMELRARAEDELNKVQKMSVKLNGKELQDLKNQRTQSSLFDVVPVNDNIFGLPSKPTQGVADGYWLMLGPSAKGSQHQVEIQVDASDGFGQNITHNIIVE